MNVADQFASFTADLSVSEQQALLTTQCLQTQNDAYRHPTRSSFIVAQMPAGFLLQHQRHCNTPLDNIENFELFWTTPYPLVFYSGKHLVATLETTRPLTGIVLTTSPCNFKEEMADAMSQREISDAKGSDPHRLVWRAVMEHDLLGFDVDFVWYCGVEIVFSTKSLPFLKIVNQQTKDTKCGKINGFTKNVVKN